MFRRGKRQDAHRSRRTDVSGFVRARLSGSASRAGIDGAAHEGLISRSSAARIVSRATGTFAASRSTGAVTSLFPRRPECSLFLQVERATEPAGPKLPRGRDPRVHRSVPHRPPAGAHPGPARVRPVHDRDRLRHRLRGAAGDRPRPRLLRTVAADRRQHLHRRPRRLPPARRAGRGPAGSAAHVRRRARGLRTVLTRRGPRERPDRARARPRGTGARRGAADPVHPHARHRALRGGPRTQQGPRGLGSRGGDRRRGRRPRRRGAHQPARLGMGLLRQRAPDGHRARRDTDPAQPRPHDQYRRIRPARRRPGHRGVHPRRARPGLGPGDRLAHPARRRRARTRSRAGGPVRARGVPHPRPTRTPAPVPQPQRRRRHRGDLRVHGNRRHPVLPVHHLPPDRPGLLPAHRRLRLPATQHLQPARIDDTDPPPRCWAGSASAPPSPSA